MRLVGKLALIGTAVVVALTSVGCLAVPTPTEATAAAPSSPVLPAAITSTSISAKLPREALPVQILAVSGKNVLVQGDALYRLSHDGGKSWVSAPFPCRNPDGCTTTTSRDVGRVANGVVINYSAVAGSLDAYSLVTNSVVGQPYTLAQGQSVVDLTGGLALLSDYATNSVLLHSLLDGTTRTVVGAHPNGGDFLMADGSVLAFASGAGTTWQRIAPDGSVTTVFTATSGTGDVLVSDNLASFAFGQSTIPGKRRAATYCVVNVLTAAKSCRTGVTPASGTMEFQYALSNKGLLLHNYVKKTQQLYWLALSDGKLAKPKRVGTLKAWDFEQKDGVENAVPVVSTWTDTTTSLLRPRGSGLARTTLSWATRAVLPGSLGLGSSSIIGDVNTHSSSFVWTRSVSATKIGSQHRLTGTGDVAASGSRWAVSAGKLRIYRNGKLVRTRASLDGSAGMTFAGTHLFSRPSCRTHILQMDEDCDSFPALVDTATGKLVRLPAVTEDAHGSLLVYRGGDHKVTSTVLVVKDFLDSSIAPVTITLPDPGTDGYYADVRVRGDWVGATQHLPDGTMHVVMVNYPTNQVVTGTANAQLLELGDGFAVGVLAHTTTLQVWQYGTGATQELKAASKVVAVAGNRLAYVAGRKLVVTTFST